MPLLPAVAGRGKRAALLSAGSTGTVEVASRKGESALGEEGNTEQRREPRLPSKLHRFVGERHGFGIATKCL